MVDRRSIGLRIVTAAVAVAGMLSLGVMVNLAQAEHTKEPGYKYFEMIPSTSQAGGHPDVNIKWEFNSDTEFTPCATPEVCLVSRRFMFHFPEGFIGNPHVALKCSIAELATSSCASDAQVGTLWLPPFGDLFSPLYNLEPNENQAGLVGASVPFLGNPLYIELYGRTDSDYGLSTASAPQLRLPFNEYRTELWGVPAAESNTDHRFISPLKGSGTCSNTNGCPEVTFQKATLPEQPYLQNPTACGVQLVAIGEVEYFRGEMAVSTTPWPETTGCSQASFNPSMTAKPTTDQADTASGLDAVLRAPQTQNPVAPSPSQIRTVRLKLPEGMSINSNAADGKVACPDALNGIGTLLPATCPEFAKIGTLTLDVSALPGPIPGAMYLAEPRPGEPYRVLLTASGFATHVKLLGRIEADPVTGQLTSIFEDLPQSPLEEFELHLFGSERGTLATPTRCGAYPVETEFVPWNAELSNRKSLSTITVGSGPGGTPCPTGPRPFDPRMSAGMTKNTAGAHSPFSFTLDRDDGDQNLSGLSLRFPPGFSATIRGVPYCSEASIALLTSPDRTGTQERSTSACPASSQVGTVDTGAGASSRPVYVPGKVYLAGPYKGAPLSVIVAIPVLSGPYDLGNVAVRAAVHVDPTSAQVSAVSDPLPQIVEGILLRTRTILVDLNKPEFTLNPTSCRPYEVQSTVLGDEGAAAEIRNHFQAANCADLAFDPSLSLRLSGGLKRRGHPGITAVLRPEPGEANLRRTSVTLPKSGLLDNSHIDTICTRVDFAKGTCPEGARLGTAEAVTPLLDSPLRGPVYLRASSNKLPDLVVDLKGQINLELVGRIDSVRGRLRTNFETVPDAPVSRFTLRLIGGSKGLLINSANLCQRKQFASVRMLGQNGRRSNSRTLLRMPCGKGKARQVRRHDRTETRR